MRMKGIILSLSILVYSATCVAQENNNEVVLGVYTGISYAAVSFKALDNLSSNLDETATVSFETNAPISFEVATRPTEQFSIGLLFSTQSFSGNIDGYTFRVLEDSVAIEDGKIELYSAARIGYVFWKNEINSADKSFELPQLLSLNRPSLGLVPIGGNIYFTEKTTVNFESAIAAPYVFRIGLQYHL
jgi:hypothetical protein